jgi:hypothetical protein
MDENRRITDPASERLVSLETKVDGISEDLREHMADESNVIGAMHVTIGQLVQTTERVSTTMDKLVEQNSRVAVLEDARLEKDKDDVKRDARMDVIQTKADLAYEKADRIMWVAGLIGSLVAGLWAVLTHFKVL